MIKKYEIDIRNEYKLIEKEFGVSILLVRCQNLTRCKCYDTLSKTGNSNCKMCGGTGMVNSIEHRKAIVQTLSTDNSMSPAPIGLMSTDTLLFHFGYEINPMERDMILIVGFDKSGIPIDVKEVYVITTSDPIRGDRGRIEYYKVYAKMAPEKLKNIQNRLNSIPVRSKIKMIKEGAVFRWPNM